MLDDVVDIKLKLHSTKMEAEIFIDSQHFTDIITGAYTTVYTAHSKIRKNPI
jgi:hypothetical protein